MHQDFNKRDFPSGRKIKYEEISSTKGSLTQRVGGKLLKLGTKDVHWTSKRLEKDARLFRQPKELTRAQQPAR